MNISCFIFGIADGYAIKTKEGTIIWAPTRIGVMKKMFNMIKNKNKIKIIECKNEIKKIKTFAYRSSKGIDNGYICCECAEKNENSDYYPCNCFIFTTPDVVEENVLCELCRNKVGGDNNKLAWARMNRIKQKEIGRMNNERK